MRFTRAMIEAAQRAEFDYYRRGRKLDADRLFRTPKRLANVMPALATLLRPGSQKAVQEVSRSTDEKRPPLTLVVAKTPPPDVAT